MGVITYTAKRNITGGRTAGIQYSFEIGFADWSPTPTARGSTAKALDGTVFETLHGIDEAWRVSLVPTADANTLAQLREFTRSVAAGEQFVLDPFGSLVSPNNPVAVKLQGRRWTENLYNSALGEYQFGFSAEQASPLAQLVENLLLGAFFTRAGDGTYWDSSSVLQTAGPNVLRQDHDPATGAYRGALVEEAATNSLLDNRDVSTANWRRLPNTLVSQNATGVDGATNTAWTLTENGNNSDRIDQLFTVADDTATHTFLAFLEKGGSTDARVQIGISGGTLVIANSDIDTTTGSMAGDGTIFDAADYWGVIISVTNNGTGNTTLSVAVYPDRSATGQSVVYDYGAVFLNTDIAYSTLLTGGTAVTRPDDVLTKPFSESYGTIRLVGEHIGGDGVLLHADNGTNDEKIKAEISSGDLIISTVSGGIGQAQVNLGAFPTDGVYDLAISFTDNVLHAALNGTSGTDGSAGVFPSVDTIRFARDLTTTYGRNWFTKADRYNAVLMQAQLEQLTA